jgi:hypothetical protein
MEIPIDGFFETPRQGYPEFSPLEDFKACSGSTKMTCNAQQITRLHFATGGQAFVLHLPKQGDGDGQV